MLVQCRRPQGPENRTLNANLAVNNYNGITHHRGCFATKLKDTRLEMLGCLCRDYLADVIRSSELADRPILYQKLSGKRSKICTVIFLTAGCAIISGVNVGTSFADTVTKLTTPAGRPAYYGRQLRLRVRSRCCIYGLHATHLRPGKRYTDNILRVSPLPCCRRRAEWLRKKPRAG